MFGTRFVILAAPRTGSNLLCTLLNSHPEILCHHELFNPQGIFYALDHRDGSLHFGTMAERDRNPLQFLEHVWTISLGARCVGFKMTRGQAEAVMQSLLNDAGVLKVILRRANRLKTFLSELIAEQTGQWEAYTEDAFISHAPRLRVDVESLKAHSARNERFYGEIQRSLQSGRQPCIEVTYESLLSRAEHARLLGFLGVTRRQEVLRPASVKQNRTDLRALIANFEELESALEGSEYQAELYDGWS